MISQINNQQRMVSNSEHYSLRQSPDRLDGAKRSQSSIINHQSKRSIQRECPQNSSRAYMAIIPLLFLTLFLSSCADKPDPTPPPIEKKEQARLVGRIASIHKNPDFALIQSYGTWNIQTGAILATIGTDGRAANLKVTGEKTGQFAAADIQSGTLEIGDSVYTTLSYQAPEEKETPPVNEALPIKDE
jgi:hypothetical protein